MFIIIKDSFVYKEDKNYSNFLIFDNFEEFTNYLYKKKIINNNWYYNDNKRLKNILDFLNAHIKSYFNMYNDGEKYFIVNNTSDLREHRAKSYKNDFEIWFEQVNLYCDKFKVKYIWSFADLKVYCNKYLFLIYFFLFWH